MAEPIRFHLVPPSRLPAPRVASVHVSQAEQDRLVRECVKLSPELKNKKAHRRYLVQLRPEVLVERHLTLLAEAARSKQREEVIP